MRPPMFFAVAALGLAAPLIAQTPVYLMPREERDNFSCLAIGEEVEEAGVAPLLEAEEALRADRDVLVFSDHNPLTDDEHFRPVRVAPIEGLEVPLEDLEQPEVPVPADRPLPAPRGVVTVGRITAVAPPAGAPVPEPTISVLLVVAATGLMRRRR